MEKTSKSDLLKPLHFTLESTTGKLEKLEDFATSLTRRRIFGFLDFNFAGSGLITGQKLSSRLAHHIKGTTIESLQPRFVAVATELGTGHEIWLRKGDLVTALNASFALPGIFRPVEINRRWLIDGALVNPVPVSVCRALGARIVIAVNLTSDFGKGGVIHDQEVLHDERVLHDQEALHESPAQPLGAPSPTNQDEQDRTAINLLQRQMCGRRNGGAPGLSEVMMDAINITQDRIARSGLAGDPPDITISPKTGPIGPFDFHRAKEAITLGAKATESQLDEIRAAVRVLAA